MDWPILTHELEQYLRDWRELKGVLESVAPFLLEPNWEVERTDRSLDFKTEMKAPAKHRVRFCSYTKGENRWNAYVNGSQPGIRGKGLRVQVAYVLEDLLEREENRLERGRKLIKRLPDQSEPEKRWTDREDSMPDPAILEMAGYERSEEGS